MSAPSEPRLLFSSEAVAWSRPALPRASLSFGLLLLFLLSIYSQMVQQWPSLEALRPVYMIGGAALAALLLERILHGRGMELVWPDSYLLFGFVAAVALSCFGALWPGYAVENTIELFKAALLYFLLLQTVDSVRRMRTVLWVMVLGGLFPALGTLRNYSQGILEEGRAGWIGIFGNPNELAYSLVILVPLAVFLAAGARPWIALALGLVVALYFAAIYLSFSRGGVLGLFAVLVLLGLRGKSRWMRASVLILLLASSAFVAAYWTRGAGFTGLEQDVTFHQRLTTIRVGLAMFADHPLSGVGFGCSVVAWPLYAPGDIYSRKWLVVHNTFIQVLSETGIVGFTLFVLLFGTLLFHLRRLQTLPRCSPNRDPNPSRDRKGADSSHGTLSVPWGLNPSRDRDGAAQPPDPSRDRERAAQPPPIAPLAGALEVSLYGFLVCALSGGYAASWFPYMLGALAGSAKMIAEREPALEEAS